MDQRSVCMFLRKKLCSASAIYEQFVAFLESDAIPYTVMSKYLKETMWMACKNESPEMEGSYVIDQAILAAPEKRPFSLVRDLTKQTCISPFTIHWRLTNSMGFVVKHLRWTPRKLNEAQLAARIHISNELLRIIRSVEYHDWYRCA
jgi:hypothetical protein